MVVVSIDSLLASKPIGHEDGLRELLGAIDLVYIRTLINLCELWLRFCTRLSCIGLGSQPSSNWNDSPV